MNRPSVIILAFMLAAPWMSAAESQSVAKPGIEALQFVTPSDSITPGENFLIGLLIEPEPGFHTYWKGPGTVGVATSIEWDLPRGFTAGPILWPPPETTDMAGIKANGYRTKQILLTEILVPKTVKTDQVTIHGKVAWMACSSSCHPGLAELQLVLPVNRSGTFSQGDETLAAEFESILESVPRPAPSSWEYAVNLIGSNLIELSIDIPDLPSNGGREVHFFSYDHQVDSNEPQVVSVGDKGALVLRLPRPVFAPRNPSSLSGVLYHPDGWPGTESKWVEISAPWAEGTFDDE